MIELASYDAVIGEIYEAALVPARWPDALTRMISTFAPRDWEVAFLLWERHDPPSGRFLGTAGVNPMAHSVYLAQFAGNNDWSTASRRLPVGTVAHTDELMTRARFQRSSLYQNFLAHWGYGVALIGMLDRHGPDQLGLVLPGPLAHEPGDLAEAITLLMPHFQRAARISRRIQEADLRANAAASVLDASPYAVFALGPDMRLQLANAAGQQLIDLGGVLAVSMDRLIVSDRAAQAELVAMSHRRGRDHTFSITLHDERDRPHLFTALSVGDRLTGEFDNVAAGASLMLIGGQRVSIGGELVAQIEQSFGLTAAEARLCAHLCRGNGLDGYMRDRSVGMHAARFVLKRVYAKTGATNQTELLAMLNAAPLGWSTENLQ
jgi:PAS domain-containing protein